MYEEEELFLLLFAALSNWIVVEEKVNRKCALNWWKIDDNTFIVILSKFNYRNDLFYSNLIFLKVFLQQQCYINTLK